MNEGDLGAALRLATFLDVEGRILRSGSAMEAAFIAVNDSHGLVPYRQAVLWRRLAGITAVSGLAQTDPNAPFMLWMGAVCRQLSQRTLPGPVGPGDLPETLASQWGEWLPLHALWLPLGGDGGLLYAADQPWDHGDVALLARLAVAVEVTLIRHDPPSSLRTWVGRLSSSRRWQLVCVGLVLAGMFPVTGSVLAPADLVPAHPQVVRAPLDGVVDRIHVKPNEKVAEGTPLFDLDATQLNGRLEVARQQKATAEAEYRQAAQSMVFDAKAKAQAAILAGRADEKAAEVAWLESQLARIRVKSPGPGLALLDDPTEWTGRPVAVGEKVLLVADESDTEVEAWLTVADAGEVRPGARLVLFLNSRPLSPIRATLRNVAYEPSARPDSTLAHRVSWAEWLLHHYLFFRIPLLRPDTLLDGLLPWTRWLGGKGFRLVTLVALVLGVMLVGRQWQGFAATLVDQFSLPGLMAFGLALGVAKIVHELGHALAAKSFGLRVPTMGVAFLVLMPVLYTDVNEAWKLADRRRRLMVGAAGVLAELTLAVWATLAWALLPDGLARQMAFTLAATTWISSVLLNLSPFMRFDGYFLLVDALDMPNLHNRAFDLARWHLREVLFGLGEAAPEPLPAFRRSWLVAFAWIVWLYRLVLFLGIAVLVYHFFIKVVGILLFAVEIGWFVAKPVWAELREWHKRKPAILEGRRSRLVLMLAGGLVLLALVPWNSRVTAPALLKASAHVVLYPPVPGVLQGLEVREGTWVEAGTVLARLDSPEVTYRLQQAEGRIRVLQYEAASIAFEDSFRSRTQAIAGELAAVMAERDAARRDQSRLLVRAPISGWVRDISPTLLAGQWLGQREPLMTVLEPGSVIEAYVAEEDLPGLDAGGPARFVPEGTRISRQSRILEVDRSAARSLPDPALAIQFGGAIPARFTDRALVPELAFYRVRLAMADDHAIDVMQRGEVHLDGERRSLLGRVLRAVATVVIREWGV
jgi:putative peptide zinc metalloprotease protein